VKDLGPEGYMSVGWQYLEAEMVWFFFAASSAAAAAAARTV